jgi:ATP phosphoribosyltransferase
MAYPSDYLTSEVEAFLVGSGLAYAQNSRLSSGRAEVADLLAVASDDLPRLVAEGDVAIAITSRDRMAEFELAYSAKWERSPAYGSVDGLPIRTTSKTPALTWGFSGSEFRGLQSEAFSAASAIVELSRYQLEFFPGSDAGVAVRCATSHPAIAEREFQALGVRCDVQHHPSPWRVLNDTLQCGLGLLDPLVAPPSGITFVRSEAVESGALVLLTNAVAMSSRTRGQAVAAVRGHLRRAARRNQIALLTAVVPSDLAKVVGTVKGVRNMTAARAGDDSLRVELFVERGSVNDVILRLRRLGAKQILQRELLGLDDS